MMPRLLCAAAAAALLAGCAGFAPPPGPAAAPSGDAAERLAEQLARCQQLGREERRKVEQLTQRLREERHKNEAMQRKIDSLRAIDREMMMERTAP